MNPQTMDAFRYLNAAAFDERGMIAVPTGAQSFFGRPNTGAQTIFTEAAAIDVDVLRANKKVAAMVRRGLTAATLNTDVLQGVGEQYTSYSRSFPLIEELTPLTSDQLEKRILGDGRHTPRTRAEVQRILAMNHSMENKRRIIRRLEIIAWEVLLTSKQTTIDGGGASLQYDYQRHSDLTFSVTAWSNATSKALDDFDTAADRLQAIGNVRPDVVIMADDALVEFMALTQVTTLADNRRMGHVATGGMMAPIKGDLAWMVNAGFDRVAEVTTPKGRSLTVFVYNQEYTASNGTSTKYMTAGKVMVLYSGARLDRYFGPSDKMALDAESRRFMADAFGLDMNTVMPRNVLGSSVVPSAIFHTDAYATVGGKAIMVRDQVAPILAATQTDFCATLTV